MNLLVVLNSLNIEICNVRGLREKFKRRGLFMAEKEKDVDVYRAFILNMNSRIMKPQCVKDI